MKSLLMAGALAVLFVGFGSDAEAGGTTISRSLKDPDLRAFCTFSSPSLGLQHIISNRDKLSGLDRVLRSAFKTFGYRLYINYPDSVGNTPVMQLIARFAAFDKVSDLDDFMSALEVLLKRPGVNLKHKNMLDQTAKDLVLALFPTDICSCHDISKKKKNQIVRNRVLPVIDEPLNASPDLLDSEDEGSSSLEELDLLRKS